MKEFSRLNAAIEALAGGRRFAPLAVAYLGESANHTHYGLSATKSKIGGIAASGRVDLHNTALFVSCKNMLNHQAPSAPSEYSKMPHASRVTSYQGNQAATSTEPKWESLILIRFWKRVAGVAFGNNWQTSWICRIKKLERRIHD